MAQAELDDEEQARAIHFRLLEQPLVADLLHPQSLIGPDDLLPTLLTAAPSELTAALEVFDAHQVVALVQQGHALLARLEAAGADTQVPRERLLAMIEPPSPSDH